jgi:predicted DCC family thiol-disulfide oxidoreductase YuxK
MKSLADKLIIYDSNCKVCSSLKDVVLRLTPIPEAKVKAHKELDKDLSSQVDPERFRNVMALIDTSGGKTLYGAEGIAYIFSSQYRMVELLFRIKPVFLLFNIFYKIQAYNRYIIATPKSRFKCDCFPDRVVKYRIAYIAITWLVSVFLTAMFGASLHKLPGLTPGEAAIQMLLIAGTGWVLQILFAAAILRGEALDYIGHLGSIMVAGLLILVPWIVFYAVTGVVTPWLPAISVVLSSAGMLHLHISRVKHLGLSQAWTVSWFLLLQGTALFWINFFHLTHAL